MYICVSSCLICCVLVLFLGLYIVHCHVFKKTFRLRSEASPHPGEWEDGINQEAYMCEMKQARSKEELGTSLKAEGS